MARARAPMITVFKAVKATLDQAGLEAILADVLLELAQLLDPDAVAPLPLKIRTLRNRYTTVEEKPCIALAFVLDAPTDAQDRDQYPATGEAMRDLAIDIVIDAELPSEVQADEELLIDDYAGLEILAEVERRVIQALKASWIDEADAPTPLTHVAHWLQELGVDNDEDLVDFEGRLVSRVNVRYRVRSDDPMVLLQTNQGV